MLEGFANAWNHNVINGDVYSRTEFFTYGITSIGISLLTTKGVGSAGTISAKGSTTVKKATSQIKYWNSKTFPIQL
ncbi:hypothetical protein J9303_05915 [Bacillaceae bacterium Marseille-Q3522]|nr:hypothetical protein [Bacillaceae bacterium Marseille-Q3522]